MDSSGTAWRVWDVRMTGDPIGEERRDGQRRNPDPILRYPGEDRRGDEDRRGSLSDPPREWLAFESATAKRRLMPIPEGWENLSDALLERLMGQAAEVVRRITLPPPG